MREGANISEVSALNPDYMGFIFYPKSKRFVGVDFDESLLPKKESSIKTVAVFVNETPDVICGIVSQYKFDAVQLHGDESHETCIKVKSSGIAVFKAFGIGDCFKWEQLEPYMDVCTYFLFDTSCAGFGGSGQKFNWDVLRNYPYNKPFILSGGISPDDVENIKTIRIPQFAGIDVNSCFELQPGLKDVLKLKDFLNSLNKTV